MLPQKKVGDQLSLADYNTIRDHINTLTPQPQIPTQRRQECVITIENTSGYDLDAFDVVQLTGPIFDREGEDFQLKAYQFGVEMQCVKPVDDSPCHVAILLEAVPKDKIGRAFVSGAVACRIDSGEGSSASDEVNYAVPVAGETYLTAAPSGIRVLCRNSGEGIQWGYVLLPACCGGEDEEIFACLEDSLTDGGSAPAKVWETGETVTVHASPLLCPGDEIDACTMIHARWFAKYGKWYVVTVGSTCHCDCGGGSDTSDTPDPDSDDPGTTPGPDPNSDNPGTTPGPDPNSDDPGTTPGPDDQTIYAKIWYESECVAVGAHYIGENDSSAVWVVDYETQIKMYAYVDNTDDPPWNGLTLYADLGTFNDWDAARAAVDSYFVAEQQTIIDWGRGLLSQDCGNGTGTLWAQGYDIPWGTTLIDYDYTNDSSSGE